MPRTFTGSRRPGAIAGALGLGLALLGGACLPLLGQGLLHLIRPTEPFDPAQAPPPPRYPSASAWAALPDRVDGADRLVPGLDGGDGQAPAAVDCFYVHGTTYADAASWNQPLYNDAANARVDALVLPVQAAVFNASCRVFAPRYRQATMYAFRDLAGDGGRALDLAYLDVEAAFEDFATRRSAGRPFILAGHSQGTRHLLRLLARRVSGTALRARLIIAYLPGWSVTDDDLRALPDIPVCATATQTGCLVSWNAEGPDPRPAFVDLTPPGTLCVNPLTWTHDGQYAGHALNLGGVVLDPEDPARPLAVIPGASDAQCVRGGLRVHPLDDPRLAPGLGSTALAGAGVHHGLDYNLFYLNLRQDAVRRVAAFLAAAQARRPREPGAAAPARELSP